MPKLELASYPDRPEDRRQVMEFLKQHLAGPVATDWERRMRFWWDENPAAASIPERGRWVHADGRLVGFGGSIPALHAWQGRPVPALYATTLCVDKRFPKAAALMFLKQREVGEQYLITHSTPNPRVQHALFKMGAQAQTRVTRHFLPAGTASWLSGRSWWPALPAGLRLVTNPAEVTAVARPYRREDRVEKWITPEYLRWFCESPVRAHHFVGTVDAGGVLSSCLLVTPRRVKGLRAWDVVESFTTHAEDHAGLHALIGQLIRDPGLLPGGAALVTAGTFPGDTVWDPTPALLRRPQQVCHFFLMPEPLRQVPKHTVMAEGDLGL